MRARNLKQPPVNRPNQPARLRNEHGIQLVEMMVSILVGTLLMLTSFNIASSMYRTTSSGENQVLATNMAQQLIDNARNSTYTHLRDDILGGGTNVTQTVSLYTYPSNPNSAVFPRPLLRNESSSGPSSMNYSQSSRNKVFNGTVTEQLTNLTPGNMTNGMIRVMINVAWTDSKGPHSYSTATTISQTGIHN